MGGGCCEMVLVIGRWMLVIDAWWLGVSGDGWVVIDGR